MALTGKLTKKLVKNLGAGRHGDGSGLYPVVDLSGARRWIARAVVKGQRNAKGAPLRTDFGLGGPLSRKKNVWLVRAIGRRTKLMSPSVTHVAISKILAFAVSNSRRSCGYTASDSLGTNQPVALGVMTGWFDPPLTGTPIGTAQRCAVDKVSFEPKRRMLQTV
jgi:hypothetical protein